MADNDSILASQRRAYRDNFLVHGETPKGTFQNNTTTQFARFSRLIRDISNHFEPNTTIHDIGSGICDFYGFLIQTGLDETVVYSGTEIVQDMIDAAHRKYPELELLNRDFIAADVDRAYDFCILSGTLNLLGGVVEEDWRRMSQALVAKMFSASRKGIAFNVLTSYRTFSDPTLCYFDPKELFDFATRNLSRFITVDAAYPLYEVTMTVYREDYLSSQWPGADFDKYFRRHRPSATDGE